MDRNRGDRYGSNNNNGSRSGGGGGGDYNHDSSYHSRRPSRFSDGPSRFSDSPSRFSDGPSRFSDTSSRFSDDPGNRYSNNSSSSSSNGSTNYNRRSPRSYRGGAGGGHRPFDSPPSRSPVGGGSGDLGGGGFRPVGGSDVGGGFRPVGGSDVGGGFRPMGGGDGGGFRPFGGGGGGFGPSFEGPSLMSPPAPLQQPLSGHKRGFPFGGRGSPTDRLDGGTFAKLFVGSVPRTASEEEIRPLFEQHGNVIEVALIKDKRTGQQQGCCFVKYATSEDADRAIKALHNQHTLPGGVGPIQVRYADGERERLGATEYKLFVGSLNKQATEKEVEEIFAPYGRVEDVYLMRDERKQSRGCGFVKYAHSDMALAAISALNGAYTMRGCDQPLTVRFADPKRPRSGDSSSRGGPAFGGPGFGPRFQAPVPRPPPNFGEPMSDRLPPNAWHPTSPQGPPSNSGGHGFGTQYPFNQVGPFVGPSDGALPATAQQSFNQPLQLVLPVSQQISPLQKPLQSPQHLPSSLQLQAPISSYSHSQTSHVAQAHTPIASGQVPFSQALPSQHLLSMGAQFPTSQPQLQQSSSSTMALQAPLNINLPSRPVAAATNQLQLPSSAQQQLPQPPSQLAQMLSQQTQTLQATFQSSQQAFSQLQQQLQMLQPSNQSSMLQQSSQVPKQQWPGIVPHALASARPATLPSDMPPSSSASAAAITQAVAPTKCNWTEHTSPDGFKYYFNSVTSESRWEKPEELTLYERQQSIQQLQQKLPVQPQNQPNLQLPPNQQVTQTQQMQLQAQLQTHFCPQPQPQPQQPSFTISELGHSQVPVAPGSANNSTHFQQQGFHASHEWMWKNKPSGT